MVEEAADATRQRPERGDVAASDEADRPIDGLADGQRAEDRGEREPSGVDDDQRPLASREVLVAADRHVPAQLGQPDDAAHEAGVAAPVVDHAGRFVDETEREIEQTADGGAAIGGAAPDPPGSVALESIERAITPPPGVPAGG